MALKSVIDNEADIPEGFESEYVKKDDKWVLDVTDIRGHPDVTALANALTRQKTTNAQTAKELKDLKERFDGLPDDFDVAAFEALRTAAESNANNPAEVQARLDAQKADLEKKHKKVVDDLTAERAELDKSLRSVLIDDGLTKELIAQGCKKEFLPAAKALLKERGKIQIVKDEDGSFRPVVDDGVESELKLADFVKKWAGEDEGKAFVEKPAGGGSNGGDKTSFKDNPWDPKSQNLFKQQLLIKENPVRARQMAEAAGQTPNW